MTDQPETPAAEPEAPANETPAQKALRLKKARIAAQPKNPRGGAYQRERAAAAHSMAKSTPWMKK